MPDAAAPFQDFSETNLPVSALGGRCMDADHGDVDGDGDIDLALAQEQGTNLVLLNDGSGKFTVASGAVMGGNGDNEDVRLRDFNADGSLDMLTVHEDDRVHALLINDGTGVFADMSSVIPVQSTANATEVIDLDGDSRLDILLGNAGRNIVLVQQPDDTFIDDTDNRPIGTRVTQDLLLLDVDGDTDQDIFVANESANALFINNGSGVFSDETLARLPSNIQESREADAADIDNDGDLDIVVANVTFLTGGSSANELLLNDGNGVFSTAPADNTSNVPTSGSSFSIKFVDLDADGDLDVLSPNNLLGQGGDIDVWINDGNGVFASSPDNVFSLPPNGSTFDFEVFDANGDGLEDIYFCNRTLVDQLFLRQ